MADNVSITFSAQIGQLVSGVQEVKSTIASIAEPVNAVAGTLTNFGETFASAFAVKQVADFISQMESLGTQTVRAAAMLGESTTETQELGFIAKATGGDADGLALSMERLQVNLQKAQSGSGPAAQALQALGLSAKSLIGLSLDEQMNRIADAVSKFADGGNKTAIVMDLLGRSGAQMIPILDQGRAGLDKLRQSALDAGAIVSQQTVAGLDRAGTAATTLKFSMTALGEAIVGYFANSLVEGASQLTVFIGDLSALIQTGHMGEAAMEALGAAVRSLEANFVSLAIVGADIFSFQWGKVEADWKAGNDQIKSIQQESDAQLLAIATQARTELQKILSTPQLTNKPQAPALNVQNKDALNASMAAAQEQIKLADEVYQQKAEELNSEFKLHEITESQKTAATLAALDIRYNAELTAANDEVALYARGTAGYQKAVNERTQLEQKFAADRQKIIDQSAQEEAKEWNNLFTSVQGAFNSQLRGLLAGTTTWANAMKSIIGDLIIKFIEFEEKTLFEHIATEAAKTTATTTGVAARTDAETAGASTSILAQIGNAFSVITADAAKTFAGVFSFLAPVAGPAAAGPAAASSATVMAAAAAIPSADVGGYVLNDGLAYVHANETITPASMVQPFSGGSGGGQSISLNLSSFNPQGLQLLIVQMMPQLARELARFQQFNPSTA